MPEIQRKIAGRLPGFFLDLDGTLAPIVARPDLAELPASTKEILERLAKRYLVCFVSGRGLEDLRQRIGLIPAFYAANHGHEISGPPDSGIALEVGAEHAEELQEAAAAIGSRLRPVEGVVVEAKGLSISVHYRLVAHGDRSLVDQAVRDAAETFSSLRLTQGRMVYEFLPRGPWNKGQAMLWLLEQLGWESGSGCPICLGDDLTDEDMFAAAEHRGVGVVVGPSDRPSLAHYRLRDCHEAALFLEIFAADV